MASAAPSTSSLAAEYTAKWDPASGELSVEARYAPGAGASLGADGPVERWIRGAEMSAAGGPFAPFDGQKAPQCVHAACVARYRFALAEAARALDDLDVASEESGVLEAPPSTWLLAPADVPPLDRVRFRVSVPDGAKFVTGVFPSREVDGAWDITLDDLHMSPYSAFGPMRVFHIGAKGGDLEVAVGPGAIAVSAERLQKWVEDCAKAVVAYYGRLPMTHQLVLITVGSGAFIGEGRTLAGGGGTVFVRVGAEAREKAYAEDWVLTHELTHLTLPSVPRNVHWAEEGMATYVEPFARARSGWITPEEAWRGLVEGAPKGLPGPGSSWGRTYWGGALFYLLSDVELRKRTNNTKGLEHALRGVLDAGGNDAVRWPLERVLATGDAATGTHVMEDVERDLLGKSPKPIDLPALWRSLGIVVEGGHVRFDDSAPLAAVRKAITSSS